MIYINGVAQVGAGDMTKAVYDPNEDGVVALAELDPAVCSETEADTKIAARSTRLAGLIANIPAATDLADGVRFYSLDELLACEVDSGVWKDIYDPNFSAITESTLGDFQANPATGTSNPPEKINDNNPAQYSQNNAIGNYAEVAFGKWVKIDQWRIYGANFNNNNGVWKIEYYGTDAAWHDWVTVISTNQAVWTSMASETEVTCLKVRLTVTTVDTGVSGSVCGELEVYHS